MSRNRDGRRTDRRPAHAAPPASPAGPAGDDNLFGPGCIGQRIQAAAYAAIASLPRAIRERAAHLWTAGNLHRLTEAMDHWGRASRLGDEQFARLFFGRHANDRSAGLLHDAARSVRVATGHGELCGCAEKIAAALQLVGLDRWSGFLVDLHDRARAPATVAALADCEAHAEGPNHEVCPPDIEIVGGTGSGIAAEPCDGSGAVLPDDSGDDGPVTGRPEYLPMPGQAGGGRPRGSGLPPLDVVPPVRNPLKLGPGDASRISEAARGGKSLWDEQGGEWRYNPSFASNPPSWDYNEHDKPNSPWRTVPTGIPQTKI